MIYFTKEELPQAACSRQEINLFFPEYEPGYLKEIGMALRMCAQCPIAAKCLQVALTNEEVGIWGGTLDVDRANLRRGRTDKSRWHRMAIAAATPKTAEQIKRAERYQLSKEREARRVALIESRKKGLEQANQERVAKSADKVTVFSAIMNEEFASMFPADVVELVKLRLANPTLSLADLGQMATPALNKDQVSGKLRRVLDRIPK